jgi:N-acetylneuraminic acid mutarotase
VIAAGCGSSSASSSPGASHSGHSSATTSHTTATTSASPAAPVSLAAGQLAPLPEARSGAASAAFGGNVIVSGGLSPAAVSTDTVFRLEQAGQPATLPSLPGPVHDAASSTIGSRLLLFGGGESEGSDRVIQVLPGPSKLVGHIPQALSDLVAATVGDTAYVLGGWNGTSTNASVYAVSASGAATTVATLPIGLRYPAAAALDGKVIIAGGENTASEPVTNAYSFDPATHAVTKLPDLPVPTDHGAGAVLNGRFYLIAGLRRGEFTDAIISWAPGETHWRPAGHLPQALADLDAAPMGNGIAVIGGRGASGKVASVEFLRPVG